MAYYLPLLVAVLGTTLYQVSAKSIPAGVDTFASLTITYMVAAACCLVLYFIIGSGDGLLVEYSRINWATFALGACVVLMEGGQILMYKAGWTINSVAIVIACCSAVILLFIGYLAFHEALTWNKVLGAAVCIGGVILINIK